MRTTTILTITVCLLIIGSLALAGTIYTWTDANGVKHYSNQQPPEGAENVQAMDEVQYDSVGADSNRQEYDHMVEKASEEADRQIEAQDRKKEQQAKQQNRLKQEAHARQVAEEKARLMNEIEALQNRALGPTFTQGMRDNLIQQIREKIDRLDEGSAN